MIRNYRRINIALFVILIIATFFAVICISTIRQNDDRLFLSEDVDKKAEIELIIYTPPQLTNAVVRLAKEYTVLKMVKVKLNFVKEEDLPTEEELSNKNLPILLIGYNIDSKKHPNIQLWHEFIVGMKKITPWFINDGIIEIDEVATNNKKIRNLCQFANIVYNEELHIELSKNLSYNDKEYINNLYVGDCNKLCNGIANRMISEDTLKNQTKLIEDNYVAKIRDIEDEEDVDYNLNEKFIFNDIVIYKTNKSNLNTEHIQALSGNSLFNFISTINNNNNIIITKNDLQDQIKEKWLEYCIVNLIKENIFVSDAEIAIERLNYLDLLKINKEIIYESSAPINIFGKCITSQNNTCEQFIDFVKKQMNNNV